MKSCLRLGSRSTRPRPTSRIEPQHVRAVGEQPVEAVGRHAHRHGVEAAPALIALQHRERARIEPEPRGVDDGFGERRDILEAHIEALPGDRMDDVRGVADQRDALGDEAARDREAERIGAARADRGDVAELQPEAAFELGVEFVVGQRDDALGFRLLLGPDDRRAMAAASSAAGSRTARPGRKCSSARP